MEFNNDRPIYIQLVEYIKLCIISGKLVPGEKILSVRDLSIKLKVNPNTLQKALNELESNRLIFTERTNGKFVTKDKELINKVKEEYVIEKTRKYICNMKQIGISIKEINNYIEKEGE